MSPACGERVLFPAVRGSTADDLAVAPGFSCRHQNADFCDNRRSLHTAELLAMAGENARRGTKVFLTTGLCRLIVEKIMSQ